MTDTRRVFTLEGVRLKQLLDEYDLPSDVWRPDKAPNTGYFGGGTPGPKSTMDKVTYASDTTAAVPGAALSVARSGLAATGNSEAGYFGGGEPATAKMDKTTYSSDTTAAVPGANLSYARYSLAASSSRANALPETVISSVPVIV